MWFSFLSSHKKHHRAGFVKYFPGGKTASRSLSDGGAVVDCFKHERQTFEDGDLSGLRNENVYPRRSRAIGGGALQQVRSPDHDADDAPAI
jgi:hypothetical protein